MQDEVDQAYIRFNGSKVPIPLHRVESSGAVQLWTLTYIFPGDVTQWNHVRYNYSIFSRRSTGFKLVGKLSRQEPNGYFDEKGERKIGSPVRLDVFRFPTEKKYFEEIVPRAILFYTAWFLPLVNIANIKEILTPIENMNFSSLNPNAVKQLLDRILETAVNPSVNNVQCLYLCVILGHLPGKLAQSLKCLFLNDKRTKWAFNRLLQCLYAFSNYNLLSPSSLKLLQKIAHALVKNSSCPGWLTFAAHFYPYFGVKYVVNNNTHPGNYEKNEYRRMVDLLLSHVIVNQHKDSFHRRLLQKILGNAPDVDTSLELSHDEKVNSFFASEKEKEQLFDQFYRNSSAGKSTKSVKKLNEIVKIKEKGRPEIPREVVHTSMLAFAMSLGEPKQNEVEAFFQLITSDQDMPIDKVETVLEQLSKSKSVRHHNLLLDLLKKKMFEGTWQKVSFAHKLSICTSWIDTREVNETQKHESGTITVYQAIDDLMSCSLNVSDKGLAEHLCENVSKRLFKDEGVGCILKAFKNVEKLSPVVQEGYKNHVKAILKQDPRLLRNPSQTLKQWSHSR